MNCGLRHFGNNVMQLFNRHASICANLLFNFLKKVVRDKRWPNAPLFVVNFSPSFGEFMAPVYHILPVHNVTINSNSLFVNFRWLFTFFVEKSYERTPLAFGETLDRRCLFKYVYLNQIQFYHCQTSTANRKRIKIDGSVAIISINISLSSHTWCIFTFRSRLVVVAAACIKLFISFMSDLSSSKISSIIPFISSLSLSICSLLSVFTSFPFQTLVIVSPYATLHEGLPSAYS